LAAGGDVGSDTAAIIGIGGAGWVLRFRKVGPDCLAEKAGVGVKKTTVVSSALDYMYRDSHSPPIPRDRRDFFFQEG
jgi:NADPH-dependent glutamate synthase beta subunit-like oxidoreductase